MRSTCWVVMLLTLMLALPATAEIVMRTQVIAAGGRDTGSNGVNLRCTVGQTAIGLMNNPSFLLELGFWHKHQNSVTDVNPLDPYVWQLDQNFPNPFNPMTMVSYELPGQSQVRLVVYNVRGEQVRTLVDENQPAGRYSLNWDGRDDRGVGVASGVYFLRMTAAEGELTRKMVLAR